jgi:HMG (high mobility group) box
LARKYKELNEKDMRKWEKKADQDKARYQEEMKHYIPADDPSGGGKKKKAKKDPDAPKRNMSAYFLYSIHIRPTVKEENPEATFGDIARLISEKFKSLSAKERKIWDDKAISDKDRYESQMEAYKS